MGALPEVPFGLILGVFFVVDVLAGFSAEVGGVRVGVAALIGEGYRIDVGALNGVGVEVFHGLLVGAPIVFAGFRVSVCLLLLDMFRKLPLWLRCRW